MKDKLFIYQEAGIPEYWLVDPEGECIIAYYLNEEGKYIGTTPFTNEDILTSKVLTNFQMDLSTLF